MRARRTAPILTAALLVAGVLVVSSPADAVDDVDLGVSIITAPEVPVVDGRGVVFVSVTNHGTTTATGVEVEVGVPPGTVTAAPDCATGPSPLTCTVRDLDPGSITYVRVDIADLAQGTTAITVAASADQADPDGASAVATYAVVPEEADLYGTERTGAAAVGTTYPLTHIFQSHGPTAAHAPTIRGTFPANASVVDGSFEFGTGTIDRTDLCTVTSTTFECPSLGTDPIASPDFVHDYVQYRIVLPDAPATVVAEAFIDGRNDPDPTNDRSATTIAVESPEPRLVGSLNYVPDRIAGAVPTRTSIEVRNLGHSAAADVEAIVTAPPGWTVRATAVDSSCTQLEEDVSVVCRWPSLGGNGAVAFGGASVIPPNANATGDVVLTTTWNDGESEHRATRTVTVLPSGGDLQAHPGTVEPAATRVDRPIVSTWSFSNASPDRVIISPRVDVAIPGGEIITFSMSLPERYCTIAADRASAWCNAPRILYPGDTFTVTAHLTMRSGGATSLQVTGRQTLFPDPVPGNETASNPIEVAPPSVDLGVGPVSDPGPIAIGDIVDLHVPVVPNGPDLVRGAALRVTADPGAEIVSVTQGWFAVPCSFSSATATCQLARPDRTAVGPWFVHVRLRRTAPGPAPIRFEALNFRPDPVPTNDRLDLVTTTPPNGTTPTVDVGLTADDADLGSLPVGARTRRVLSVDNAAGGSRATGIRLVLDEIDGLSIVSARIGWLSTPCRVGAGTWTCDLGYLPPGASRFVVVEFVAVRPGPMSATATVSTDQVDGGTRPDQVTLTGTAT